MIYIWKSLIRTPGCDGGHEALVTSEDGLAMPLLGNSRFGGLRGPELGRSVPRSGNEQVGSGMRSGNRSVRNRSHAPHVLGVTGDDGGKHERHFAEAFFDLFSIKCSTFNRSFSFLFTFVKSCFAIQGKNRGMQNHRDKN
jgi:hypothetical protein